MSKNFKSAFTLAEVMIIAALVGTLATISISVLNINRPNKELLLFRKAYQRVTNVINDMINDDELFPNAQSSGLEGLGAQEFLNVFAARLGGANPVPKTGGFARSAQPSFVTPDGMAFWFNPTDNCLSSVGIGCSIYVDVDGIDKGDNCSSVNPLCNKPDRFEFKIRWDGKVYVRPEVVGSSDRIGIEEVYLFTKDTTKTYSQLRYGVDGRGSQLHSYSRSNKLK